MYSATCSAHRWEYVHDCTCSRAPDINRPISCSCLVYRTQLNFTVACHITAEVSGMSRCLKGRSQVRDLFTLFDIMLCWSPGGSTDAHCLKLAQLSSSCKATWNSTSQCRTESGAYISELIICFNKKVNAEDIPPLCINRNNIERVNTFKLLGVFVSSDLSWD